jgi:hypothetical protein
MRTLNKKQKKLLTEWAESQSDLTLNFKAENLPTELYENLEKINDHETIYQNIERFIHDIVSERMFHGGSETVRRCPKLLDHMFASERRANSGYFPYT